MAARYLSRADTDTVRRIIDRDPVANVFASARVDAGVLARLGPGELLGYPAQSPRSLLHVGSNLVPVEADVEAIRAFAESLGGVRLAMSIVGPSIAAMSLWGALSARWGAAYSRVREVRPNQPVMVIESPPLVTPDPRLRVIGSADFASYFRAAVDMYTEEVGVDPLAGNASGYRRYVQGLVDRGLAFGIVDQGRVVFKADVGNASRGVAQIQGVWLAPDLRGRGLAASAMAAVVQALLGRFTSVCLYVNDYNRRAIATYHRVGFVQCGEFATVLY